MPQLPSGLSLALSRAWLFDHGGNWVECPEGHFWYWTAAPEMGPGPYDPNETVLRSAEHAPVPRSRAEVGRFIIVLEMLSDGEYGWRGEWLASFPRFTKLTDRDRAAWDAWMQTPATERFLDDTIAECERLAEASRDAQGYAIFTSKPPLASQHLRAAADQGDAEAQFRLGYNYGKGLGVPQDYDEAVKWLLLAAGQRHPEAIFALGLLHEGGHAVQQNHASANKWFRVAAALGHVDAQFRLGITYAMGETVPQDYAEAARWLRLAANQGHAAAQSTLAYCYANGLGIPQDHAEARQWYHLAADNGDDDAQNTLGDIYALGLGVPKDFVSAYLWFSLAAAQGHKRAVRNRYEYQGS